MKETQFDVIFGTLSKSGLPTYTSTTPPNCRVWRECRHLPELHTASDVVVCGGGYNSLVEAISGGAHILVNPVRTGDEDEQTVNAMLLAQHYPVRLLRNPAELEASLRDLLRTVRLTPRAVSDLDFGGTGRIRSIILEDLGFQAASTGPASGTWRVPTSEVQSSRMER